jgi:orotate phosphoribosyltransferase
LSAAATLEQLGSLLRRKAVLHGDFVLASGRHSEYYVDARVVTLSSAGAWLVGQAFLDRLKGLPIDGVAGLAIGADPIVAAIATCAGSQGVQLDGFIVRKERKEHGAGRRIEGPWRDGLRIAIVDDTLTTGASSLEAARAVEDAGASVEGVYALIDREQGAQESIERAGYSFQALFTAQELLEPPSLSADR